MEKYFENLPPQWWDGRFTDFNVQVSVFGRQSVVYRYDNAFLSRNIYGLFLDGRLYCSIEAYTSCEDGIVEPHPFFKINDAESGVHLENCKKNDYTLYYDTVAYGANITKGKVICYHALMLRPFQNQTGFCIGAIRESYKIESEVWKENVESYIIDANEFCENVKWQHLVKYAKPYSNVHKAANVVKYPIKEFEGNDVVPLYITNICVGAKVKDFYISFEDYKNII